MRRTPCIGVVLESKVCVGESNVAEFSYEPRFESLDKGHCCVESFL